MTENWEVIKAMRKIMALNDEVKDLVVDIEERVVALLVLIDPDA